MAQVPCPLPTPSLQYWNEIRAGFEQMGEQMEAVRQYWESSCASVVLQEQYILISKLQDL